MSIIDNNVQVTESLIFKDIGLFLFKNFNYKNYAIKFTIIADNKR